MNVPKPVQNLIEAFERLPGIGPKTAKRLTFYLLHVPEDEVKIFAQALFELREKTVLCEICFNVAEKSPCRICTSPNRDKSIICVVEDPLDLLAIEATTNYKGLYHILHGVISPVNRIGPEDLRISELIGRIKKCQVPNAKWKIREIIIATNPSMEGEATAMYLKKELQPLGIKITRIARGLPTGGDLEYADPVTLSRALEARSEF